MGDVQEGFSRVPPHSLEAEESIIGGLLIDKDAFDRIADTVRSDDFYVERHCRIYAAMVSLVEQALPLDVVTVADRLKQRGELTTVGGVAYLAELTERVPTAANVTHYARIVREKSVLRRLIRVSTEIAEGAYESRVEPRDFVDRAEQTILEVSDESLRSALVRIDSLIVDSVTKIEALIKNKSEVTGVASGFFDLDRLTAGFQPSDLIIVAGRPSMGKTALCLNIAEHVALEGNTGVAVFSLEMSKEQLVMRMLCSQAGLDLAKVRTGMLKDRDFKNLALTAGRLGGAPIYIDDTPALSVIELRAKARRLKREPDANLGLIIVDYLQLMRGAGEDSREQEISNISRSLKSLAKELSLPVVALSQLNRQVELRSDKRPVMADLRECVTGETLVVLSDGCRVPIRDLVGCTPRVVALGGRGSLVCTRSTKVWAVGRRRVLRVRLASGLSIRATKNHRLLSEGGWKRVGSLHLGQRLALARGLPELEGAQSLPDRELALLGHLGEAGNWQPREGQETAVWQELNGRLQGTTGGFERYRDAGRSSFNLPGIEVEGGVASRGLIAAPCQGIYWDRVVSIQAEGEEEVYDLTVPGPASWLADGLLSHNSGAIEQDADVIAFIYRDEQYHPDSADAGLAEIIVGKQRNGPTGHIRLMFDKEFARFRNLTRREEPDGFLGDPEAELGP